MSQPQQIDLNIHQGEDYTAQWYWLDMSDNPYPVIAPVYLSVATLSGTTVFKYKTAGALSGWNAGFIEVSNTSGFIQLSMSKAHTALLPAGSYVYDMFVTYEVTDVDGDVVGAKIAKFIQGNFIVSDSITVVP
jgi:hypothetical protein